MELIKDTHYEGERPLFATHNLHLENVTIHTGESALKECSNIAVSKENILSGITMASL